MDSSKNIEKMRKATSGSHVDAPITLIEIRSPLISTILRFTDYTVDKSMGDIIEYGEVQFATNDDKAFLDADNKLVFSGESYIALPFQLSTSERKSNLPPSDLTLAVSNIGGTFNTYLAGIGGDLVGANVSIIRTLVSQLSQLEAAYFPIEKYVITQKITHNNRMLSFRLDSFLSLNNVKFPRRLISKKCTRTYRVYSPNHAEASVGNPAGFVYGSCPFVGGQYFDIKNVELTEAEDYATLTKEEQDADIVRRKSGDRCPKTLIGCQKRFPEPDTGNSDGLPFQGFPALP